MVITRRSFCLLAPTALPLAAQQAAYPPSFRDASEHVYKTVAGAPLKLWVFAPQTGGRRPAIVFFFGGGWRSGSPVQFAEHCRHLAGLGMVAIVADYRVLSRHGAAVASCVRDAKSAVRWIRSHAGELRVDPGRIAAGGGSAGGHLAAATALLPGWDDEDAKSGVSARPNALVLFNPALILAPAPEIGFKVSGALEEVSKRMGGPAEELSPHHHIRKGAPPTIIFHGKADTTVPYSTAEAFTTRMLAAGNRCHLVGYDGQTHGFFNYGRGTNPYFKTTVETMDEFLASLGYLGKRGKKT